MDLDLLGVGIDAIGEVLVVLTALLVHKRILEKKRLDRGVFSLLRREEFFGTLGLVCIVIGSLLQIWVRMRFSF